MSDTSKNKLRIFTPRAKGAVHVSHEQKDWTTGPDPTFCGADDTEVGVRTIYKDAAQYEKAHSRTLERGDKVCPTCHEMAQKGGIR